MFAEKLIAAIINWDELDNSGHFETFSPLRSFTHRAF
jgi:hypothetical protein